MTNKENSENSTQDLTQFLTGQDKQMAAFAAFELAKGNPALLKTLRDNELFEEMRKDANEYIKRVKDHTGFFDKDGNYHKFYIGDDPNEPEYTCIPNSPSE